MIKTIIGLKIAGSIFAMGMVAGIGTLAICKNAKKRNPTQSKDQTSEE